MFGSIGANFVFYDGREKSPSAPLHRDLTPLVSTFWPWLDWHQIFGEGFMMVVREIHWCQNLGHGSIGTKFSVRVLWWQWNPLCQIFGHGSIGTKFSARVLWWQWNPLCQFLAMARLAPNFRWGFYDGSEIHNNMAWSTPLCNDLARMVPIFWLW